MGLKSWVLSLAYAKWSMRKDIRKFVRVKGHITGTFYFSKHFNREAYDRRLSRRLSSIGRFEQDLA